MTELHPAGGQQIMTKPFPKTRRVTETAERSSIRRTSDRTPLLNRSIHRHWELLAIWSFVAVSFAAFFIAGYVIWAKCRGR